MSYARSGSISDTTTETSIKPIVSTLRVVEGATVEDATPFALALTPPAKVARGRQNEHLFFLFNPTDAATPHLCREIREVVTQTYWATSGSVTAALRRATSLANRYLFEHNLNSELAQRCYGGLSCAVLRDSDLFLLQAGPAWACVLRGEHLQCFPRGERLAHIGIGPVADVRLHHVLAVVGDTLLLASSALLTKTGKDDLVRVLARPDIDSVRAGLKRLGAETDFGVLIARWTPASDAPAPGSPVPSPVRRLEAQAAAPVASAEAREVQEPSDRQTVDERQVVAAQPPAVEQPTIPESRKPRRHPDFDVGGKMMTALRGLGQGLGAVWHGVAAVGAGAAALGRWLVGAIGVTVRRTLPGPERKAYRRAHRRPPPRENPTVMTAVAAAIPILVIVVVTVAYLRLAAQSRFQAVIEQAEEQIALAQSADDDSNEARTHWEQALQQIEIAAALQPEDASTQALREQTREALDRLDRIERLKLSKLVDFGSSGVGRRLVLHGEMVFVLDAKDGWGARVPLDGTVSEPESVDDLVLVHTGQQVDGNDVGRLVDCTWVDREGGRRSSALVVLEEDGWVVSYDPAWGSESGAPKLTRGKLGSPPPGRPIAVGAYSGHFYVLDVTAEDTIQIWRYRPEGDGYPHQPEPYFTTPPSGRGGEVMDMAIDGYIYLLYSDGTVEKFLGGEPQQFEIRGVPGGLGRVAGFAVDPDGTGTVYVADPDSHRIVELGPDGLFRTQLRAGDAFAALEALTVNETDRRLLVLEGGRLQAAALP